MRFAKAGKNIADRHLFGALDFRVHINEAPAEPNRQLAPDTALARSHKTDQEDALAVHARL